MRKNPGKIFLIYYPRRKLMKNQSQSSDLLNGRLRQTQVEVYCLYTYFDCLISCLWPSRGSGRRARKQSKTKKRKQKQHEQGEHHTSYIHKGDDCKSTPIIGRCRSLAHGPDIVCVCRSLMVFDVIEVAHGQRVAQRLRREIAEVVIPLEDQLGRSLGLV